MGPNLVLVWGIWESLGRMRGWFAMHGEMIWDTYGMAVLGHMEWLFWGMGADLRPRCWFGGYGAVWDT